MCIRTNGHVDRRSHNSLFPIHGSTATWLRAPAADLVSEGGTLWARAPLLLTGDDAIALIVHRRGATHVSLRGATTDVAGNDSEVTIIRAYGLAP